MFLKKNNSYYKSSIYYFSKLNFLFSNINLLLESIENKIQKSFNINIKFIYYSNVSKNNAYLSY